MNRELTKWQTIIAFLVLGWAGMFVIMVVGDYQVSGEIPPFLELLGFAALAIVFAPLLALAAAWKGGWLKRRKKEK